MRLTSSTAVAAVKSYFAPFTDLKKFLRTADRAAHGQFRLNTPSLPRELQTRFNNFLDDLAKIHYLEPKMGFTPPKNWDVSSGRNWELACEYANTQVQLACEFANAQVQRLERIRFRLSAKTYSNIASAEGRFLLAVAEFAVEKAISDKLSAAVNSKVTIPSYSSRIITYAKDDATRMAKMILLNNFEFPNKVEQTKEAEERMEAWRKGYGVAAYFDGILYVYLPADVSRLARG